jgi:hypothetical protein
MAAGNVNVLSPSDSSSLLGFVSVYTDIAALCYVSSLLTWAYHASWSAMPLHLGSASELSLITPMESVVLTSVSRPRLYGWLGINVALTLAATVIGVVSHIAAKKMKTVRNTTLAALRMDVFKITRRKGSGPCNAASLNKGDSALGRMKWKGDRDVETYHMSGENYHECHYRK